jgi:sulfotransferase family protein
LAQPVTRIAMWSGPRTVSTALMRSFGSRPDTVVADEPLYAFYLAATGIDHPGRTEILASMRNDWREVLTALAAGPLPPGKTVHYAKHMTHHLLPEVDRRLLAPFRHAYLIRDPDELLASYARVRSAPTLDDLGIRQQAEIFTAYPGPVLDSRDLLSDPAGALRALCGALGLAFTPAMLSWPPGPRDTDGVWGRYWYDGVWRSSGFGPCRPSAGPLPGRLVPLARRCRPYYEKLYAQRLTPAAGSG